MTFSTTRRDFSEDVVSASDATGNKPAVGARLDEIIQRHGFKINQAKVRVQRRNQRQVVTGLKINRFPNPSRKLFSQVRAMLHALEKFNLAGAERVYRERFAVAHRSPLRGPPSFLWALRGKIQFIGAIRGQSSPKFVTFARKLHELAPGAVQHWDIRTLNERITDALWVLECEETCTQGTAFFLKDVGLITCEHVVHPQTKAFKANEPAKKFPIRVRFSEPTVDLAICDFDCSDPKTLAPSVGPRQKQGDPIILAGFPDFQFGDTPHIAPGVVVQARTKSAIERLVIDTPIVKGNSGGPVLNPDGAVVGVAVTGTDRADNVRETADYGVIPIVALKHLDPTLVFNPVQ
jgi:hypothetical protein